MSPRLALAALALGLLVSIGLVRSTWYGEGGPAQESVEAASAVAAEQHSKLALLVGLDRSQGDHPPLEGAVRDAELMRELLLERFAFDEVTLLRNEEATHRAIVENFVEKLIMPATEGTETLFFFAGHGSRVPDESGQELNEQDTSFLAYDSRAEGRDGEYDFTDDELRSLCFALTERGARVTVITDSCYSGGGSRGEAVIIERAALAGSRGLAAGALEAFWPEDIPLYEDGEGGDLPEGLHVHLAACGSREVAREIRYREGGELIVQGVFSHFLLHAMRQAEPGWSYADVLQRTRAKMWVKGYRQHPQSQGELRRGLFEGRFSERPLGIEAYVRSGKMIMVRGGWLDNLRKGWVLAVKDEHGQEDLGRAVVTHFGHTSCAAKWQGEAPDLDEGTVLRVIPEAMPDGRSPVRVCVADESLRSDLADLEGLEVGTGKPGLGDLVYSMGKKGPELRTYEGVLRWPRKQKGTKGPTLKKVVAGELRLRALLELAEMQGEYELDLELMRPEEKELGKTASAASWEVEEGGSIRVEGRQRLESVVDGESTTGATSQNRTRLANLRVTNLGTQAVYVHLISVSEDGEIFDGYSTLDKKHQTYLKPRESAQFQVGFLCPHEEVWPMERAMRDRYLVLATLVPINKGTFGNTAQLRSHSGLPAVLDEALSQHITRGITVETKPEGWGLAFIDVWVEKPD